MTYDGLEIRVGKSGDIYVGGGFTGEIDFGEGIKLGDSTHFHYNYFLVRISPDGKTKWARKIQISRHYKGAKLSLAVDGDDHIYFSGNFRDSVRTGPEHFIYDENSRENTFLAKFDSTGNPVWLKHVPSRERVQFVDLEIAPTGDLIAFFESTDVKSGPSGWFEMRLESEYRRTESYVCRINSAGKLVRSAQLYADGGGLFPDDLAVLDNGRIWVSGITSGSRLRIGGERLELSKAPFSDDAGFFIQLDENLKPLNFHEVNGEYIRYCQVAGMANQAWFSCEYRNQIRLDSTTCAANPGTTANILLGIFDAEGNTVQAQVAEPPSVFFQRAVTDMNGYSDTGIWMCGAYGDQMYWPSSDTVGTNYAGQAFVAFQASPTSKLRLFNVEILPQDICGGPDQRAYCAGVPKSQRDFSKIVFAFDPATGQVWEKKFQVIYQGMPDKFRPGR